MTSERLYTSVVFFWGFFWGGGGIGSIGTRHFVRALFSATGWKLLNAERTCQEFSNQAPRQKTPISSPYRAKSARPRTGREEYCDFDKQEKFCLITGGWGEIPLS